MAHKYFGEESPIGKTITINNEYDFTVTGVLKDIPQNSFLQFNFLVPIKFYEEYFNISIHFHNNILWMRH